MFRAAIVLTALLAIVALPVFAQTPIQFGEKRSVSICNGSTSFSVDALAGDRLAVILTELQDYGGSCSPGCCCFDQWLNVQDANGMSVQEYSYVQGNCCGCLGRIPFLNVRLDVGGSTIINVGDANSHGGGLLKLIVQRVNAPGLIEDSLSVGANYLSSLTPGDAQTFIVKTADTSVHHIAMKPAENSPVVPRLALYNNGRLIDADEDEDGEICFGGTPNGQYVLLAYSALTESGLFRLNVASVGRCPVAVEPTSWGNVKSLYR